ncbi:MAG: uroporphyrinogen-III C-methyltransferase [Planctomycetota bacterium]
MPKGIVSLVGAGPGDPELLTLAGRDRLAQADVVVYDALANSALLRHALDARHVYAGKRAEHHSMTQDEINRLLVDEAKAGRRVVRLKGGDPFVFGRGGEEAEACVEAGVAFEVIPGITAAVAAAAYAGIPVTHRDLNTSITLVTGHEKDKAKQSPDAAARDEAGSEATDWAAMAKLPLLCVYMGVKKLGDLSAKLIEHGKSPDTPAASVQWGTLGRQKTVVATLGTIADAIKAQGLGSPAITYVGEVVRLRETLRWFDNRPLSGKTVVVTRSRQQASELSAKLAALGADVVEVPTIELRPPSDQAAVEQAFGVLEMGSYEWLIFTSPNGVVRTRELLEEKGFDFRSFWMTKVACVGPATARTCWDELRLRADLVPDTFDGDAVAEAVLEKVDDPAKAMVLMPRADIGRPSVAEAFRKRGVHVDDVAVYETKQITEVDADIAARVAEADVLTFTSGSTARGFFDLLPKPVNAKVVSIGPRTSEAVVAAGQTVDAEASEATIDALVDATLHVTATPSS